MNHKYINNIGKLACGNSLLSHFSGQSSSLVKPPNNKNTDLAGMCFNITAFISDQKFLFFQLDGKEGETILRWIMHPQED